MLIREFVKNNLPTTFLKVCNFQKGFQIKAGRLFLKITLTKNRKTA